MRKRTSTANTEIEFDEDCKHPANMLRFWDMEPVIGAERREAVLCHKCGITAEIEKIVTEKVSG